MKKLKVAVIQVSAGREMKQNLRRLARLVSRIGTADIIALPEVFSVRGSDEDYRLSAQPLDGPVVSMASTLARDKSAWVLAGSIIERAGRRAYNTSVLLDRRGRIRAVYRKIHLFEAHLEGGRHIRESDAYSAGTEPVMASIEGWRAGLGICYDLRFPELARHYSSLGASLLFLPSNFTQRTGRDHWEVLLRARAIENQCFVVAPNQCGENAAIGVASYGHSMIIGPWGEVIGEAESSETILAAELDPALLKDTRRRIPALRHRVLKM